MDKWDFEDLIRNVVNQADGSVEKLAKVLAEMSENIKYLEEAVYRDNCD